MHRVMESSTLVTAGAAATSGISTGAGFRSSSRGASSGFEEATLMEELRAGGGGGGGVVSGIERAGVGA